MLMADLRALMIDSDNFEKNVTSIYVTNGVGSRIFGNLILMRDPNAVKFGNENKQELSAEWGEFATSTRNFPMALNRTENLRHLEKRSRLYSEKRKIRRMKT
jgi:hypothetical protein